MAEWYEIENLRTRVGLASDDPSKDTELIDAADVALAVAESYCDRKFMQQVTTDVFTHIIRSTLSLTRYPVETITSLDPDIAHHIDMQNGVIFLERFTAEKEMTVVYEGGYDPVPKDLNLALKFIFDTVYASASGAATGGVKSVKLGDLSISYDTGSGAKATTFIPATALPLLDVYRRGGA